MCGRYTLAVDAAQIQQEFDLPGLPDTSKPDARYNIAPMQTVPIISNAAPDTLSLMRWGLVPSWSKDPSIGNKMINARAETLAEKPSFKTAFVQRRCLVPATGFFEWQQVGGSKVPQYIHLRDHTLFAFAGLWEAWRQRDNTLLHTFTIVTTEPNEVVRPFHHRMAVMLKGADQYAAWLSADSSMDELQALLQPYAGDDLTAYEVSSLVNSTRNDTPEIIEPHQPPHQPSLF
jgi:putative SOS response-associated peptidase YedK